MRATIWIDPMCPYCWVTSRWVVDVSADEGIDIDWQPIPLQLKNDLAEGDGGYRYWHTGLRVLRVMEAMRAAGSADRIGDLYAEVGRRVHMEGRRDIDLAPILDDLGVDPSLAAAADEAPWDEVLRAGMEAGLALTGDDVGTPLLAVGEGDERRGVFGPVITEVPEHEQGRELWRAVVAFVTVPGFSELKRARSGEPQRVPDHLARAGAGG